MQSWNDIPQTIKKSALALFVFSALGISAVNAAEESVAYKSHPEAKKFIASMATKHGFDKAQLQQIFAGTEKKQDIIDAMKRPAEKVLEWKDYRRIFLTDQRIAGGKEFMKENKDALIRAEAEYGVPAQVITAIIGVETLYGRHKGRYRVIDALSTLAFDYPPRSKFFRSELEHYLLLGREQGFDVMSLTGSYAGAMGYGQFIPSSYRSYAVDFNGDKIADILTDKTDAIGSVANYLARHGWRQGESVAMQVEMKEAPPAALLPKKQKPAHSVGKLKKAGVPVPESLDDKARARLMALEAETSKEYWLGLQNFYVITRYNHSDLYAMAVFQLSEAIRNDDSSDTDGSVEAAGG
ncbi:lytic murein transglycosylase B [Hahella chejuensis KCTC 2396]|uniref:Lytic murein transglycosylase B n=1 Tax=Hahella chejuensis (strain KCTC 2396) TaxID=349521 RepID=Q2SA33_HAHCH|nr:lytic murein transglycosylase B [Hahella chejuensis]ABC32491.1 lytic murein transglycosylase B [Hahella chejuensis KCTC 2396]